MSRSDRRTRRSAPTSPCTTAWNANVSFGQGEKPKRQLMHAATSRREHGQHRVQRRERLGEPPARAILLLDLVRDHAHLDAPGRPRDCGGAQHAVALHRLDRRRRVPPPTWPLVAIGRTSAAGSARRAAASSAGSGLATGARQRAQAVVAVARLASDDHGEQGHAGCVTRAGYADVQDRLHARVGERSPGGESRIDGAEPACEPARARNLDELLGGRCDEQDHGRRIGRPSRGSTIRVHVPQTHTVEEDP